MWYEELRITINYPFKSGKHASTLGKAVFGSNGSRRYFLEKTPEGDTLIAFMMTPSNTVHNRTVAKVDQ